MDALEPRILIGDVFEQLATLPDASVHCVVTSPPYFMLRDYGVDGQIGLEPTLDEFLGTMVRVFREVRRVLRSDGTLWLNVGDSYVTKAPGTFSSSTLRGGRTYDADRDRQNVMRAGLPDKLAAGLKPKNMMMVPARVALALQQPYYAGRIKDPSDRRWLAGIVDSEGCIHIHRRKAGADSGAKFTRKDGTEVRYARTRDTYGVMVSIDNTCKALIDRCEEIIGLGSRYVHEKGAGKQNRKQTIYRLTLTGQQSRDLLCELYPDLVAKQREARIAYHSPSSGEDAAACHEAVKALHNGADTSMDKPAPPSLFEPGWYLRSDVIWAKSNPMPESAIDRPTSAHEHVFLLTKAAHYYYDADAVREEAAWERCGVQTSPKYGEGDHRARWLKTKAPDGWDMSRGNGGHGSVHREGRAKGVPAEVAARGRNKRSVWKEAERHEDAAAWLAEFFLECMRAGDSLADTVWSIATEPFAEAHFATFPTKLVEPCVLAGTSERGVCPDCGAPWERTVDVAYERSPSHGEGSRTGKRRDMRRNGTSNTNGGAGLPRLDKIVETTGWRPTCACYDDLYRATLPRPRASKRWQNITWWERARARPGVSTWNVAPAVVLDPFAGACTTLLVARRLNRASIGVELNSEYAELGRRRLERWWDKPRSKPTPVPAGQLELLAIAGGTDG